MTIAHIFTLPDGTPNLGLICGALGFLLLCVGLYTLGDTK